MRTLYLLYVGSRSISTYLFAYLSTYLFIYLLIIVIFNEASLPGTNFQFFQELLTVLAPQGTDIETKTRPTLPHSSS